MKTIRLFAALAALMLSGSAFAYSIAPGDADWSGTLPKNPDGVDINCIIAGETYDETSKTWSGTCDETALTKLYKDNVGGPEEGTFASSYETEYFNTPTDPQDATISYISGDSITCATTEGDQCYLIVKDGNQDPIWYIFDISDWNGTDAIVMTGFWPAQGAISHVGIYGGGDGTYELPEPGTLGLLGLGLFGMGVMRRKKS
jgi:hypothetical protein